MKPLAVIGSETARRNYAVDMGMEKEVQVRAYELYEQRGKGHGFALQDWLEAEAEVLARYSNSVR